MNTENHNINVLIEQCKKNEHTAQMEIYKNYYKAMYNSAFRILKNEFEAEDVMQESFLNAFTKLNTYKGEVTFGAWLKRIVINKSLTQLKKNNRYNEVKMDSIRQVDITNEELNYDAFDVKTVLKYINSLKENYRIILNLHLIEGFDNEEIAQILKYTNENVRTTISRAKKKLKEVLLENTKKKNHEKEPPSVL